MTHRILVSATLALLLTTACGPVDEDGDGYAADVDCDDTNPAFNPGALEMDCDDPNDYNCDGSTGYVDADADGFPACRDCNDAVASIHPDADEVCDDVDNDCDGTLDEFAVDAPTWYADADGDTYGNADATLSSCEPPAGYVANDEDCDDLANTANPDGTEVCDGLDNDCNGTIDDNAGDLSTFYADTDGDGAGDWRSPQEACAAPKGHVDNNLDCDDTDDSAWGLGWCGDRATLTPCGATGREGPDQTQCDNAYGDRVWAQDVTVNAGFQELTIPHTASYVVTVSGAQGSSPEAAFVGGRGASLTGVFEFVSGQVLTVVVGQQGLTGDADGGGGGGTFVVDASGNPLIVAGGGGGTRIGASRDGCPGLADEHGSGGSGDSPASLCPVKTTDLGQGGQITSPFDYGAAGAGFLGDGQSDGTKVLVGTGGASWSNGMLGGEDQGVCTKGSLAHGGFGGGGSGAGCNGGGGGGGYSGGDGGWIAGGGGSFNVGKNPGALSGANTGNGSVTIQPL